MSRSTGGCRSGGSTTCSWCLWSSGLGALFSGCHHKVTRTDTLAFSKAAFDQVGHGRILLHVTHLEFSHDFFAAFHFEIGVGKHTTAIALVKHYKAPVREGLGNFGGEILVHNALATACFTFFSGFGGFGQAFDAFLSAGQRLTLVGKSGFSLSAFFLNIGDLRQQGLNVTRVIDLLLQVVHQLGDLFEIGLYHCQFLLLGLGFGGGVSDTGLGGFEFFLCDSLLLPTGLFRLFGLSFVRFHLGQIGSVISVAFAFFDERLLVGPSKIAGGAKADGRKGGEEFPDHGDSI